MLFFSRFSLAFFALLIAASVPALSMTVTPTQIEMVSTGRASHAVITVVNDDARPLPVELIVKKADFDEHGSPTSQAITEDDFLIMPPQALIPPGATQNFRLQWLGEPLLNKSESFFVYVNQIPVKLKRNSARVQVVFSMGVMLNVAPPRGEQQLKIIAAQVIADNEGRRRPVITVENPGNVHALFPQWTIRLASKSWSQTLPPSVLDQSIGIGLVQPGHRRRFVLPVSLPASVDHLECSLELRSRR